MTRSINLPASGQRFAVPVFSLFPHPTPEQRKQLFERTAQLRADVVRLAMTAVAEYPDMDRLAARAQKELGVFLDLIVFSMVDSIALDYKAMVEQGASA